MFWILDLRNPEIYMTFGNHELLATPITKNKITFLGFPLKILNDLF